MVRDQGEIHKIVEEYFRDIFKSRYEVRDSELNDSMNVLPQVVTEEMGRELLRPYNREEVKYAVFQMSPTKALSLDGYAALFYPMQWRLVGDILSEEVLKYLNEGKLDKRINLTRISLVPKCKDVV
ncbi:hypothetical protein QQ045_030187 [Rhodiola kirilowii]